MAHHRDAAKERSWRQRIHQWQRSGQTIRDFCAKHSLSEPKFYAWRRELARRDAEARVNGQEPARFVPVLVQPEPATDRPAAIEIVLGSGRRLRVGPGFDAATLSQVVAVLEEGLAC